MLTSFDPKLNIDKDPVGYIIGDYTNPNIETDVALYIPRLMTNIEKPKEKGSYITEIENESNIFVNDKACRPKSKTKIKCRNYIESSTMNSNLSDLENNQKVICELYNDVPVIIRFKIK